MVLSLTRVSVIIPIYNTASYLMECLDSVLNQSLRDIEVICVNDGSTDASLEILESYKLKDNRISIINQENKGSGAARNIAMKQAKGDYIMFIDSDDYIEEDMLIELYGLATQKVLDLIFFKIINFNKDTYEQSKSAYLEMKFLENIVKDEVFNWQVVKNRVFDLSVTAPGKFFKRDTIKNVQFPEDIIFEDNLFFIKSFFRVKRAYFYNKHLYFRRVRSDSVMNSYYGRFSDCITVYDRIGDYLKHIRVYDEFSNQLFDRKCKDIFTRFSQIPLEYKQDFFEEIKDNFSKMHRTLQMDGTLKICDERNKEIFYSALKADTYTEFELYVELFDLRRDNDKLKLKNSIQKRQYENKISKIKEENEDSLIEIEEIKSSTSWGLTGIFRKVVSFLRDKLNFY